MIMKDPTAFIDSGLNISSSQVYVKPTYLTDVVRKYRVCLPCSYTSLLYTFKI